MGLDGKSTNGSDIHKLAIKALAALNKSSPSALQMDEVPPEVLHGEHLILDRWTLVINDDSLKGINIQGNKPFFRIDPSQPTVSKMFHDYWSPQVCLNGLVTFSCVGAKEVSDYGLALVARHNNNLKFLDITGCIKITDSGLREIGIHCINLQSLKMTSCHSIEGVGLISIAECCKRLSKLDISSCRSLQRWSAQKVFYNCFKLEEVNMSNLKDFGDDEVRVLAQNAPNLFSLLVKDTPLVSDTSILVITQNCFDLDVVDLSRTQFGSRIQDVTLLALSQKCPSLRVLRLTGCVDITDVGLQWLAEGCKALEELDLNGCIKITDAGLRSLGGGCHALTSVDISHAKLVSDVGINTLSAGCPKLNKLVCHGLYLLSDPRLSAPKKGEKVQAWHSVVGIAALASSCPTLEHLDLTGSFRLNKVLHDSLSSMKYIKVLNLSGCNQATSESLIAVGEGCTSIEELNLSDCGKSINNAVIASFTQHCPGLRVVVLSRCEGVRAGAIRALAKCDKLEKLDCTGCKSLTDIMMVPLCEVDKVPLLRTLILVGVHQITDSTVAWISNKSHGILLLALKGTNVSKAAIQAVRDRFPNSDITYNDNFIGFWPKFRVEDRKLINHYQATRMGIIRIQARQRKGIARRIVTGLDQARRVAKAVLIMQCSWRIYLAHRRVFFIRKEINRENDAAIVVTSVCHILTAMKRVRERRAYLLLIHKHKCAIKIQVHWRMHWAYGILQDKLQKWRAHQALRERSATTIQAMGRRYFAVNRILRIKAMRRSRLQIRERKAGIIQRNFRGYKERKVVKLLRAEYFRQHILRIVCAKKIQKKFRIYRTHKYVRFATNLKSLRLRSCVKIQSLIRGALSRLFVAEMKAEETERAEKKAAIKIQSSWRVKAARKRLQLMMFTRARERRLFAAAALTLQKYARAQKARKIFARKKQEKLDSIHHLVEFEMWAVTKIQSIFRGMKGRMRFDAMVREKKGKWKELFDDEKQKRFFYNKLTGEVRWRMPSDLLDLVPHPTCDNCTECEAKFECAVCDEVYCQPCFTSVHKGGRRKDHEFRALYDYYGRRLDYGDGVFPCKWPSEIVQDEVQGWMLRVAPIRDPTAVYGGWEEYSEIETNGATGKVFYFNRSTFEATYDKPLEIQQAEFATSSFDQTHNFGYYDHSGNWVAYTQSYDTNNNTAAGFDNTQYYDMSGQLDWSGNYDEYNNNNYYHQQEQEQQQLPQLEYNEGYHNNSGAEQYHNPETNRQLGSGSGRVSDSQRSQTAAAGEFSSRGEDPASLAKSFSASGDGFFNTKTQQQKTARTKPIISKRGLLSNK